MDTATKRKATERHRDRQTSILDRKTNRLIDRQTDRWTRARARE